MHYEGGGESLQSRVLAHSIFTGRRAATLGSDTAHLRPCGHALDVPDGTAGCRGQKRSAQLTAAHSRMGFSP